MSCVLELISFWKDANFISYLCRNSRVSFCFYPYSQSIALFLLGVHSSVLTIEF